MTWRQVLDRVFNTAITVILLYTFLCRLRGTLLVDSCESQAYKNYQASQSVCDSITPPADTTMEEADVCMDPHLYMKEVDEATTQHYGCIWKSLITLSNELKACK